MIILVPTRGRPENIVALREALDETVEGDNVQLWLGIDDDDPVKDDYLALNEVTLVGPRLRLGPTLNTMAAIACMKDDIVGFLGDDHRPRTAGWNTRIEEVTRSRSAAIIYGNDLIQGENLPTAVFMTSNIIRALGYMSPPELLHSYADNFWRDLGSSSGSLVYLPDVIIEHVHPLNDGVETDQIYRDAWALAGTDSEVYKMFVNDGRLAADVEKLKALF